MATRNELVTALAERYGRSSKAERGVIFDEFVAVSGYHPQARDPVAAVGREADSGAGAPGAAPLR
jgi:hypothetical protein